MTGGVRDDGIASAIAAVLVAALALAVYRPWESSAFPVADFGALLEVFQREPGFLERSAAIVSAYAHEGRFFPLSLVPLAGMWSLFGDSMVAWSWMRAALMLAVTGAAVWLLVRLGIGRLAAVLASSLFVFAGSAITSWMMPQIMEPLGLLFTLGAAVLASDYRAQGGGWGRAFGIAVLLVAAVAVKETFVGVIPFIVVLGCWRRENGEWRASAIDAPTWRLVVAVILAVGIVNIGGLLVARSMASSGAYAAAYAPGDIGADRIVRVALAMALPVTRLAWFPANLLLLVIAVAGLSAPGLSRGMRHLALAALLLPVAGMAVYLPWPALVGHYALPFFLGMVIVFGVALDGLLRGRAQRVRLATLGAWLLVAMWGSTIAMNIRNEEWANRAVVLATARGLAADPDERPLAVAVADPLRSGRLGDAFVRWAGSLGVGQVPTSTDISCAQAASAGTAAPGAGTVRVLQLPGECGTAPVRGEAALRRWSSPWSERSWKTFRATRREAEARLWVYPGAGAGDAAAGRGQDGE